MIENACHTIMKKLQKEFGKIKNVTDRSFLNNSFHVPVYEKISIKDKIDIESGYTWMCAGGNITYVELDGSVMDNLDAIEEIVQYAMEANDHRIAYFAINTKNDACTCCGYQGIIDDSCPKCNAPTDKIKRLRRVTGYLNSDYRTSFNKGKREEVEAREQHSKYTNMKVFKR